MEQKNMLPGLTREAEEQKLQEIIGIAQQNLERARADIRKVNEDLEDLLDVYEAQDKEGLALWNNATARLKENEYDLVRYKFMAKNPQACLWDESPFSYFLFTLIRHIRV